MIRLVNQNGETVEQGNHNLLYSRKNNPFNGCAWVRAGVSTGLRRCRYSRNRELLPSYWPISEGLRNRLIAFNQSKPKVEVAQ
jgi:hypothetical protein